MKDHKGMHPQDIVILLPIVALQRGSWKHELEFLLSLQNKDLTDLLKISTAKISASLYRSAFSGLIEVNNSKKVFMQSLFEFLINGLKYVFPVRPGALVRGIPTAHSAEPLKSLLTFQEDMVWEHPEGIVRGQAIMPLYSTVPEVVKRILKQQMGNLLENSNFREGAHSHLNSGNASSRLRSIKGIWSAFVIC